MDEKTQDATVENPKDPKAQIRVFVVSPIETNCYAFIEDGHAMVVDPGADGARVAEALGDVVVDRIVATHGHGDHVGGVAALKRATNAPFYIAAPDAERAQKSGSPGSLGIAYDEDAPAPDGELVPGESFTIGSTTFQVVGAPGHTEGGVILLADGLAFTGDTIFKGAVGRTDLVGGDPAVMEETIERLKTVIPAETLLLPGHGEPTTMAQEIETNPYF